ncbi:MAG: metal-dependent hydrolase [Bacteroidales bacterium]|nr:metal-dependent hydrolase [Bacteroidales bacterium]
MADFRTHLTFGSLTGFAIAISTYLADWVHNIYMAIIIYFATVIGSFLPDMDSDSGHPVKIIFEFYAYISAALTIYYLHDNGGGIYLKIFLPIASFFFVRLILIKLFNKYTSHRGIFHSVPAFLIVFFLSLLVAWSTDLPLMEKFSIALAVAMGYFSHLLLDEIYSVKLLNPSKSKKKRTFREIIKRHIGFKRSFGTALDLGFNQKSKYPAIIAYIVLGCLIIADIPIITAIFKYMF